MNGHDRVIDAILAREGGYVDHPADRGGPTNHGITQAAARAYGWHGDMSDLPEQVARAIYMQRYIIEPRFDMVATVSEQIAAELIDTGVNMGPSVAASFFQRWLNAFNQQGSRYADLFVDGRIGPVSIEALKAFVRWRGVEGVSVMICALNCVQGARYLAIAENNPSQEAFVYGWMRERVTV